MMQHSKLMSPTGLAAVKKEINDALDQLGAGQSNTQNVYTNLSRIFDAVADHPQAQLAVDSTLATEKSVRLLSDLVRMHLREEEVQWVLGRVLSLASQASIRFQCQAGQIEMWNELFDMRSAHPQSIRVQEASLRASKALFRSNEFHIVKLRSHQLLDDLLGVMDRFLHVQTPRRRAQGLVVLALQVMAALYSSSRPTGVMLFNGEGPLEGEKWAREISRRMLDSFGVFNRDINSICSWLDTSLLLLRQHPGQAMEVLYSPAPSKEVTWWFVAVAERWQPQAEVMSSLLATLTHMFALPHTTLGDQIQVGLAEKLMLEHNLLDVVCGVIHHYHHAALSDSVVKVHGTIASHYDAVALVLLEATRVVRQWSERPKLIPQFEASHSVKVSMLPILLEQLHLHVKKQSSSSVLHVSPKHSVLMLEILLVFRYLAASHSLRGVLAVSESLQTCLLWLRCSNSSVVRPASNRSSVGVTARSAADTRDDGDVDALVAREARNLHKLVATALGAAPIPVVRNGNPHRDAAAIVTFKTTAAPRRQLRAEHVKAETLRVYCNGNR